MREWLKARGQGEVTMGSGQSIEDEIFNLRLASKQLLRQSQQCSKAEKDERLKVSGAGE